MRITESQQVEVSIIVPVYNAVNCIDRCVASLVAQQTAWKYEILLVDDGSSDGSLAVLREWERRDKRIRVLTQPNQGPSAARNYGLREARGNYIIFADADDWVEPYYIDKLRNTVDNYKSGLVMGGFFRERNTGVIDYTENPQAYHRDEFHQMIKERELYRKGFICGKMYKTDVIRRNGLSFNKEIHYGEDLIFLFSYLIHIEYVRFIDRCGYHYDQTSQEGSLGLSYHSYESELRGYHLLKDVVNNLVTVYHISEEEIRNTKDRLAYFALRAIKVMYRPGIHHLTYKERVKHLSNDLTHEDIGLLVSYSTRCQDIDKIIGICLRKRRIVLLDILLSLFFLCRYSWVGKFYMKQIWK